MKTFRTAVLIACLALTYAGCAHRAVILPADTTLPHLKIGTLEVATSAHPWSLPRILSLGLIKPSYHSVQRKLDKKLAREALDKFDADAIMNIEYWPEPGIITADRKIRARAAMVELQPFPKAST